MLLRLSHRIETALTPWLPEQRLFLKSDTTTRFVRLRPLTQAVSLAVGSLAVGWFILASAILLMDFINAGSSRDQVLRQSSLLQDAKSIIAIFSVWSLP